MQKLDNIILIGMMGSGKSTIASNLAKKLNAIFLDTDSLIEDKYNKSISEIINISGVDEFRLIENNILKELYSQSQIKQAVIATGGGIITIQSNREKLKQLGKVVWLDVQAQTILERLKEDATRPLLQGENKLQRIQELLSVREELYSECANYKISVDNKEVSEIVEEIELLLTTTES